HLLGADSEVERRWSTRWADPDDRPGIRRSASTASGDGSNRYERAIRCTAGGALAGQPVANPSDAATRGAYARRRYALGSRGAGFHPSGDRQRRESSHALIRTQRAVFLSKIAPW